MSELKECPFCKCTEIVAGKDYTRGDYRVDCLGCSAFITAPSLEIAIQYWNTRPIEGELRAELEKRTKAFTMIDQFITHYNDAVSAGKVSVDVKPVQRPADPSLEEDE